MAIDPSLLGVAAKILWAACDSSYKCETCGKEESGFWEGGTLRSCCGKTQCKRCIARGIDQKRCQGCGARIV